MAYQTTAELLAGFDFYAMRPDTDESITDVQKYVLLSQGQEKVYELLAAHVPEVLYGAPTLLTTADGGYTYTFPTAVFPYGAVEIRASRNGQLLIPGTEFSTADYTWEGDSIRIPNGKTRTFADGPYGRWISSPTDIAAAQEPTLSPATARPLILFYALYLWAERGGGMNQVDPNRFLGIYQSLWSGDPRIPGDAGILAMLKRQGYGQGMAALNVQGPWYKSINNA